MSRYRPPTPARSPYVSARGYRRLQQEAKALWRRRQGVVEALSAAAAEGDRSENAEYIYRKKELRGIDRRIRYLQKRLPRLKVVRRPPDDRGRIFFGARVTLEDETGAVLHYRILGVDEFHDHPRGISIDSPLARALLGREVDDEVRVDAPGGRLWFLVTGVDYDPEGDEAGD